MAHEHTGDCCGHQEQHELVHQHAAMEVMGRLCCTGHCNHPEHQMVQAFMEHEQHDFMASQQEVTPLAEAKKKAKKKKRLQSFGHLLLQKPTFQNELTTN